MKRLEMWLITVMLVAGAAAPVLAQGPPPGASPQNRIAAALGLNEQQQAAWTAARQTFWATAKPLHAQAKALRGDIKTMIDSGNPDPALVGQKTIALYGIHQQIRAARETMDNAVASVLSSDQKLKLEGFKAAHRWGHRPAS